MTPEAAGYIEKARDLLAQARVMLGVDLNDAVGRTAYLAEFHAAQALIFQRTGRSLKTHHGVHTEFLRLTKDDVRIDAEYRIGLSQAYNLKASADYEIGPNAKITAERASAELARATQFVELIAVLVSSDGGTSAS